MPVDYLLEPTDRRCQFPDLPLAEREPLRRELVPVT